jgi:hypothetical protein
MSHTPSRIVAVVASLALAGCSTMGTRHEQQLDAGAAPQEARTPYHAYPCQDFEFLCIVAVGAIVAFAIVYSQDQKVPAGVVD